MRLTRKQILTRLGGSLLVLSGGRLSARAAAAPRSGTSGRSRAVRTQLAMAIDTKACLQEQGCTRCLAACHEAHNVPYLRNPAHRIDWIREVPAESAFAAQGRSLPAPLAGAPVLVLCNHCDNPPCVPVCPTGATWKRETDGIVMMDWHRCIGCRYCMVACPYGARSFNWVDPRQGIAHPNPDFPTRTDGVVEKCTFCSERLAQGQVPVCVEVCPVKALVFGDVNDPASEIRKVLDSRPAIRRRPELGTGPNVYYLL